MIRVIVPAADLAILSIEELREAAGVLDNSRDSALERLGLSVAAALASACNVPSDGIHPRTLLAETIAETIQSGRRSRDLILARRPVIEVLSVSEGGADELEADAFKIDHAAGILVRYCGVSRILWSCREIVLSYRAGYEIVPADLKLAASKMVKTLTTESSRDPHLKRRRIEGVSEHEWWVEPTKDSSIPPEVMQVLCDGGYVNFDI